jgi:hypothetical protein
VNLPTIGRIVIYRSETGNYSLPAIVTATQETLWQEGVERGDVEELDSPEHVHLHVFTPGVMIGYAEYNVPPADLVQYEARAKPDDDDVQPARSWAWPRRQ